jgi:hypothetical protein
LIQVNFIQQATRRNPQEHFMRFNTLAAATALALATTGLAAYSTTVSAESKFLTAPNPSATAALEFQVNIPSVLYLQVGTGAFGVNDTTQNEIEFDLTAAQLANPGTAVTATAKSGDLGDGAVTVRVFGNNGVIALTSTTTSALTSTALDTISWSQINTAVTGGVPHPVFVDGATSAALNLPASGKVTDLQGTWTYSYANATAVAPGAYKASVTYTATMP